MNANVEIAKLKDTLETIRAFVEKKKPVSVIEAKAMLALIGQIATDALNNFNETKDGGPPCLPGMNA